VADNDILAESRCFQFACDIEGGTQKNAAQAYEVYVDQTISRFQK